ncbi:hypothetical protein [Rhizobium grahamii]|uniref:Uncharacterized protein n=2 Tax=Rhizobium grahamii TaxID=1120045 RepID=S3I6G8_9HYPH|nr:hypothetical protein [Rhizobium grahamii]EPE95048.1 hypothetical protein RGCCGE502_26922 [Rhizobium grahamii CCGE 502]RDJ07891.1 hypothetical protein B5K06_21375 [Rhizobium grahamii]
MPITLTPAQVRGLKLAKDGDLFRGDNGKWTHLNATVTYAKNDRFKERPQKVKVVSTATVEDLKQFGLLQNLAPEADEHQAVYGITMAGKIWLMQNL